MRELIETVRDLLPHRPKLASLFANCFPNTFATTIKRLADGSTFVITGDIPAMWLRDSAAQVRPYLILAAADPAIADLIAGVVRRQVAYILHDPYANAFNETANGRRYHDDLTAMSDLTWERKYEIDSLCYPLQLAYLLWRATGRTDHLDDAFRRAAARILAVWRVEQRHETDSPYRFQRPTTRRDPILPRGGRGTAVAETGMTWSGFRPSDGPCAYGFLVPANMFATVVLGYLVEIADAVLDDPALRREARDLAAALEAGIRAHATVEHPAFGPLYAYETDGRGNHLLMDDANVPSLLSLPYLGYCAAADPLYRNTRAFVLSRENPYYYAGKVARGVGSPHTRPGHVWPLALAMQGLTATDPAEREEVLRLLEATDAGTGLMHESFSADDPATFTRPWFAWANALFSELVLDCCGVRVPGSPSADAPSPALFGRPGAGAAMSPAS